jgi:Cu2+-containing amine oxidase
LPGDIPGPPLSNRVYLRSFALFQTLSPGFPGPPPSLPYFRDSKQRVAVECRETGIAWLCKQDTKAMRRMHEIVIWGVSDAGNYDNIIEYRFREDGSIGFRYGATGYNDQGRKKDPHIHDGIWRVSTKLFNRTDNEVLRFQHESSADGRTATDSDVPIINEQSTMWEPLEFTNIIVRSTTQNNGNDDKNLMGYEFTPWNRTGTARHSLIHSDKEQWSLADFYVTNNDPGEDGFDFQSPPNDWRFHWHSPDDYLLSYLNGDTVGATGDGIVVWYTSSAHHEPSDADSPDPATGYAEYAGVTPVHWSGFDMEPHNLFQYNPIGGPARCGN